jgi:hypothetical protein
LGDVPIDFEAVQKALELPQVTTSDAPHAYEHSLEVQLPFLQTVLGDFSLVPFAVGDATAKEVSEVIDLLWGGAETLIVVSSDLSHYHRYAEARSIDRATGEAILAFSAPLDHEQACGATPDQRPSRRGTPARARGRAPRLAQLGRHRGRPESRRRLRIVRFRRDPQMTLMMTASDADPRASCCSASPAGRSAKGSGSRLRRPRITPWLASPGATFVRSRRRRARGCIGSLEPRRPLGVDVRENAIAAALPTLAFPLLRRGNSIRLPSRISLLSRDERIDAPQRE